MVEKEIFPDMVPALSSEDTKVPAECTRKYINKRLVVSIWSDWSRLNYGWTGAEVAWRQQQEWRTRRDYLGNNKEVFHGELYAIAETVQTSL